MLYFLWLAARYAWAVIKASAAALVVFIVCSFVILFGVVVYPKALKGIWKKGFMGGFEWATEVWEGEVENISY